MGQINPEYTSDTPPKRLPERHPQASDATHIGDPEYLIRRAFDNDPDVGMAMLFRYYYQPLCSHAVRFVSSKEIAEDLVSDIFFEMHSRLTYQAVATSFRAFLFTAVRNRALDYIRTEYKQATSLEHAQGMTAEQAQQPDGVMQYEELYHSIEEAINGMPVKQRTVYLMHRFEGKRYADIAVELQMATKTVEVHMYRATQAIRELLRSKWLISLLLCWLS
ncbi:sigma-70 family RNA polymerase sigma factor [Rudanella paleaurantiibacter]|uniref:Sigma-70 family RNA polymerase sigma factor n=1 Tax=Rudanella paleaurantiibacter TaxID=2614655 RepID=A0A7J5TUM1_9BACT|nr:sigma-70 family RNA polymerase sigma factor [Rudanella paleaurantiibacter]KAB7727359.1 sigma-70 family RNA polymerase sigma factor [Rudanella paleaurantiibacter]